MKKVFPYILIVLIVVQLFAPFTLGINDSKNKEEGVLTLQKNQAEASTGFLSKDLGITLTTQASVTDHTINLTFNVEWEENGFFSSETVFVSIVAPDNKNQLKEVELKPKGSKNQSGSIPFGDLTAETTYKVYVKASQNSTSLLGIWANYVALPRIIGDWVGADKWPVVGTFFEKNENTGEITNNDSPYIITTLKEGETIPQDVELKNATIKNAAAFMPDCEFTDSSTWSGCIGRVLYYLVFKPSAFLFAKTGQLLDFTVGYSLRDQSYRSSFVVEGWRIVRDFCNLFFIFILLYIAFGTILKLNGVKTKEMIINVVIIGLLINFSLFATQVIIDASNILTRIFYNNQTIKVGSMVNGEIKEDLGPSGELKLSEALVAKVNPVNLVMNASEVDNITPSEGVTENEESNGISAGTFILVVILASAINIVGLVVFLTCSLLFITRVIGLWLAMIFAPLAFFSYAAPKMQEIPMIGWKKWWPDTLKLAFMAPVFVFFLYLIIKFLESGLGLSDASNSWGTNKMDFVLKTFVPFIFIMILLLKAKKIAVMMSGEMGESVSKVGAAVAGIGLAAATGGAAMAMRGTIGRAGSSIANSEKLKAAEAKGGIAGLGARTLRNIGGVAGKGSFDVRATQAGAKASKGLGVDMSGKGSGIGFAKIKEGGFEKRKAEQIEKRQKKAKELEVGESHGLKQKLNKTENDFKELLNKNKEKLDEFEKGIKIAQEKLNDATSTYGGGSVEAKKAGLELQNIKAKKKAFREGTDYEGDKELGVVKKTRKVPGKTIDPSTGKPYMIDEEYEEEGEIINTATAIKYSDDPNNRAGTYIDKDGVEKPRTLNYLENVEKKDIQNEIIRENNNRKEKYAKSIQGGWSQALNFLISGGQHSFGGEKEAAHKIIADIQDEKK